MDRIKSLGIFIIFSLLFFVATTSISAQALPTVGANMASYQQPTGANCNINVPAQYSTIQAGIDASNNGDTVCVAAGTYNENVIINKSIRLSGSGVTQSTIVGQITENVPGYYTLFVSAGGSNSTVEGFYIKGVGTHPDNYAVQWSDASLSLVTFRYNWIISGNGGLDLGLDGQPTNGLFSNNIFEGNNSPRLAIGGGNNIDFLNNTFMGTVTSSAQVLGMASINSLVKRNTFVMTGMIGGILIRTDWSTIINENNLEGGTNLKVNNYPSGGTLNAENNWWGDNDPSNNIDGDVDYIPFVTVPFPEYPLPSFNQPPVANAGIDQVVNEDQQVNFDGSGSTDPDGNSDIVSYS